MNNGEYEIDRYIKEMEDEVKNLKTAHQRPLGALDFFKKSKTFRIELDQYSYATFYITVRIAPPNTKPPIVQTGWSVPQDFFVTELNSFSISNDYEIWTYNLTLSSNQSVSSVDFKVSSLSSQPILDIEWGYR